MQVYALVGPSGTGKSHRSVLLAHQMEIEYIIDDGLLIKGNQVVAGRSAKREVTKMGATKRAIFSDPEHAAQVREKIRELKPGSILILGISQRMVEKIAERLQIPRPEKIIRIEEIATPEEISRARETREKDNRHAIPIPAFAIEKDFPGYLLQNIKAFFLGRGKAAATRALEHAVVRPLYSSLGNYYLSETAIEQIIAYIAEQRDEVARIKKNSITSTGNGMILDFDVAVKYGAGNIPLLLASLQEEIKTKLEFLTGFQISRVNLTARHMVVGEKERKTRKKFIDLKSKSRKQ